MAFFQLISLSDLFPVSAGICTILGVIPKTSFDHTKHTTERKCSSSKKRKSWRRENSRNVCIYNLM